MRRRRVTAVSSALLFLCIVLAPHHGERPSLAEALVESIPAAVVVSEFYPCGLQDDEYFVLDNIGGGYADLFDWTVTDLEGSLRFASHLSLAPGESLSVSSNSSSYLEAYGVPPDIALNDECTAILRTGTFRLADAGDSIALLTRSGSTSDLVIYGVCDEVGSGWSGPPVPALKKGEVARRVVVETVPLDTNSSADWTSFREHRYGFTSLDPQTSVLEPGDLTAFVSPDCGLSAVLGAVDGASREIRLCSYEFSSAAVCRTLAEALWSGVRVRVLVDGSPAGGMADGQIVCLSFLQDSGADVRILLGNMSEGTVQHVGPLHAKYIVIDDSLGIVLSENFVESGLPADPFEGNRGWGIAFRDGVLAGYLGSIFDEDSRPGRRDVRCWSDDPRYVRGLTPDESIDAVVRAGILGQHTASEASRVTIVPSPDGSPAGPFLAPLVAEAHHILVEQFQADLTWRDRWTGSEALSPLVGALEGAIGGGANASVLLDPSWFNSESNSAVAAHVNEFALSRGLIGEAKLMDCCGPATVLHNKGLVLDGLVSVVSSNNWGASSFARNRELAVIVDSAEVARYYEAAFWMDWEPDTQPPIVRVPRAISAVAGEEVRIDGSQSSDDRGIARWIWSLEGDGLLVPEGSSARFYPTRPGSYPVRLSVRDAWGNMDTEVVTVEVVSSQDRGARPEGAAVWGAAIASASCGVILGALAARKLNHHNRGIR